MILKWFLKTEMSLINRLILLPGVLILVFWLVLSVFFQVERLYGDSAYYLFQLVNDERFVVEHGRPVSVLIQWIPYILTINHIQLSDIILWFSLNEWIYWLIWFCILAFVMREPMLATGLVFTMVIGSKWNYYNPVSELILSIPLLFTVFALLRRDPKFIYLLVMGVLLPVIIFSHPLNFILTGFLFLILPPDHIMRNKLAVGGIAVYVLIVVAIKYFSLSGYEMQSMEKSDGLDFDEILTILSEYNYARLIFTLLPAYLGMFVLIVLCAVYRKKFPSVISTYLFAFFLIGYFSLVMYKYGHLFPKTYEPFERYMILIPVAVGLVSFGYILRNINVQVLVSILLLLSVYHLSALTIRGNQISDRNEQLYRAINYSRQFPAGVYVFRAENYYLRYYGHDWIMSNESILISAANSRMECRQVFIKEAVDGNLYNRTGNDQFLYSPYWEKSKEILNSNYFYLSDTGKVEVNTDVLQDTLSDSELMKVEIELIGNADKKLGTEETCFWLIKITNGMSRPLFSGMQTDGIQLAVRFTNQDGHQQIPPWHTPILADVHNHITQELRLHTPGDKGVYNCDVGIIFRNGRYVSLHRFADPITIE
jgi:hypothetical protein